jgi:hypothetical protein
MDTVAAATPALTNSSKHHPGPPPPGPSPTPVPGTTSIASARDLGKTVFDGADYDLFAPSFDVDGAAARAVAAYDRNDDGAIEIGFLKGGSSETSRLTIRGVTSIADLARQADRQGNGDGSATAEEIASVIRAFDQGSGPSRSSDGRLEGNERRTFLEVFGEDRATRMPLPPSRPKPLPRPFPDDRFPGERIPLPAYPNDRLPAWEPSFEDEHARPAHEHARSIQLLRE